MSETRTISAEEFDRRFDEGEDITPFLDLSTARRPNQQVRKVNVDFTTRQLGELDEEAARLGIPRQAVIKTLCDEALTRRRIERRRAVV